jgi:predicted ATPase
LYYNEPDKFNELKKIAMKYLGISDIVIETANKDIKVKRTPLSACLDLSELSAGEKQLLILLDALVIQRPDNIYFIEEPEVHVHSKTQKEFLKELIKRSENSQFFITTHSPNFFKLHGTVRNYWAKK